MTTKEDQDRALRDFVSSGAEYVIGIDEVGYGAWAGPLVVAGLVFQKGWGHPEVKDSKEYKNTKKRTAHQYRSLLVNTVIEPQAKLIHIATCSAGELDHKGVHVALNSLMAEAMQTCIINFPNSIVIVDGLHTKTEFHLKPEREFIAVPAADSLFPAVSAASIVAKVYRDSKMMEYSRKYPGYEFDRHMGYGTKRHREMLEKLGPCFIHRLSYKPLQELSTKQELAIEKAD